MPATQRIPYHRGKAISRPLDPAQHPHCRMWRKPVPAWPRPGSSFTHLALQGQPEHLHPLIAAGTAAYLLQRRTCNAPVSCEEPEPHSTEAQAARERACDSLCEMLLHNQQRKRKNARNSSFISPPDDSWSSIGWRPSTPAAPPIPFLQGETEKPVI